VLPTTSSVIRFNKSVVFLHQRRKRKSVQIQLPENIKGEKVFSKQYLKNLQ